MGTKQLSSAALIDHDYDLDGNLTGDGKWIYTWNGENRLVAMQSKSLTNGAPRLEFAYDYMSRRFSKVVSAYDTATSDFQLTTSHVFLYDGWNLIAETELNPQSEIVNRKCYTWGLDLSLTLQGAGGVGGLLSQTTIGSTTDTYYPVTDANGNITDYIDGSGDVAAHFEYDAFGKIVNTLSSSDDDFPFRFSSKYEDVETDLNYYAFRYYAADTGRWLNRDPIGEHGGLNLLAFIGNRPVGYIDPIGLRFCRGGSEEKEILQNTFDEYNPWSVSNNVEVCGWTCKACKGGGIYVTKTEGDEKSCEPDDAPCEEGDESISMWHTHGTDPAVTSPDDRGRAKKENKPVFVSGKDGNWKMFDPANPRKAKKYETISVSSIEWPMGTCKTE